MSDAAVLVDAQTLLKPIAGDSPVGQDPEMNPDYINLDAEMAKMSGLDYEMIAEVAQRILTSESKHLRVATWLTLGWTKLYGVTGLRNGLEVIVRLLDEFAPDLFPEKAKMQSMALQNLHSDKRIAMFAKKATNPDSADIADAKSFLDKIAESAQSLYEDKPPTLDGLREALEALAPGSDAAPTNGESIKAAKEEQTSETPSATVDSKSEETVEDSIETSQDESASNGAAETAAGSEDSEQAEPEEEKIAVPDEVQDLLDQISDEEPAGEDVEKTDDQEVMVEYMTLESEMAKFSGNNYEQCAIQCSDLLRDRTKHLRIAIWQLIAWYRTLKLTGFRDGLALIYHLLNDFTESIHPQDVSQQANTLQLLNSEARIKLLEKEEVTKQNADIFKEIGQIFEGIVEFAESHYEEKPPRLTDITAIIHEKSTEAANFEKEEQRKKEKERREAEARAAAQQQKSSASSTSASSASSAVSSSGGSASSVSAGGMDIGRERDAQLALKKAIEFYFEEDSGGSKNRKVAEDSSVYGLSRIYRWGRLNAPPSKDQVTQIEGPNEPKQNYIQKLISNKDYDTLIPEIEVNFLNRDDFLYWLDAQKFVCEALDAKGGDFMDASQEIKVNLARLIQRAPDMSKLMFKDKETPFASNETRSWIDEEVMSVLGSGKAKEKILPPVMGEDYEPINEAYEKACEALPDNFEENIKEMQQGISGDTRPKGRFLRLLNLANYCHVAGQYSIARVRFKELRSKIEEYNIIEWEQALCVAVWQSTYINNLKLLQTDLSDDQREQIQKEQAELFDQISKYDSILALNLMNREKEEGE